MREPDQRFYDAMIIKCWRDFKGTKDLIDWSVSEFGRVPWQLPLVRNKHLFGGVRAWVATRLPILNDKLWSLPPEKNIEILDWLGKTKMDCDDSVKKNRTSRYVGEARVKARKDDIRATQATWSNNLGKTISRNNQWTVVKGKRNA